jgi:hypothetical protein
MATSLKQDLIRLAKLKRESSDANKAAKEKTKTFKDNQRKVLDRMRNDDVESLKSAGTLFSPVSKEYATIEDRSEFVRWALENSEPIANFLAQGCVPDGRDIDEAALNELIQAIHETSFVQLREHADPLNALVRERLDDGQTLPPGVGFRTDEYISLRKS